MLIFIEQKIKLKLILFYAYKNLYDMKKSIYK